MRTSGPQFELLVEYMERNGDLNRHTDGPEGRFGCLKHWAKLTSLLNADSSGCKKTSDKWKKVWSDLKNNTKRKAARCRRAGTKLQLTDLEQRVLNLLGPVSSGVVEIGLEEVSPEAMVEVPPLQIPKPVELLTWHRPAFQVITIPITKQAPKAPITDQHEMNGQESPVPENSVTPPLSSAQSSNPPPKRRRLSSMSTRPPSSSAARARYLRSVSLNELKRMARERDRYMFELEKERLRVREKELQQVARWQDLIDRFIPVVEKFIDYAIDNRE